MQCSNPDSFNVPILIPSIASIQNKVDELVNSMRDRTIGSILTQIQARNKKLAPATAYEDALKYVDARWTTEQDRLAMVSGKDVLSGLSRWCKVEFNVSFGKEALARELMSHEIDLEVMEVLAAIETRSAFPHSRFLLS